MSNKIKIILIAVFVIILLLIGLYFYNKSRGVPVGDSNTSLYQKFNPFGTSTKNPTTTNQDISIEDSTTSEGNNGSSQGSKFHKLTNFSISGATFFEDIKALSEKTKTEVTTDIKIDTTSKVAPSFEIIPSLRYVERATGHIYQMSLNTSMSGKISNSTVPSVYEAIFNNSANSIIYRYLSSENKSITSFVSSLGGKGARFLPSDIIAVSLSPDKTSFFSIIKNSNGVIGEISSFDETKTNKVFTSSFSEWLPQWSTENNIYLTTKPSYLVEGDMFSLNIKNETLSKVFGGIFGLTTLANNDGTNILYGSSLNIGPKLFLFNIKDHTSMDLDTYGLPEKCVWSNDNINIYCSIPNTIIGNQYPDYWYQGLVSFDDRFIKINTETLDIIMLANSSKETPIDGTNLFLNKDESGLFFTNKKDSTLWSLDL